MKSTRSLNLFHTPTGIVAVLGVLVLSVELLIMLVIHDLLVPAIVSEGIWAYIDALLLTLLVAPALYFLVFREMQKEISEHNSTQSKLQETTHHTQSILENTIDGIITINSRGVIASFNPAAERIFGYAADEAIGKNVSILIPEPYHSRHDGYIENYQRTGEARIIGFGREVVGLRKDGCTFPMDLAISEAHHNNERIFIGITRDITERKHAETALLMAKDEAEQASKTKSLFLSGMSHELRTPLNAILGFGQLLEMKAETCSPEQNESVKEILAAGYQLLGLINELLEFSRIDTSKLNLNIQSLCIADLTSNCVNQVNAALAIQRHITIENTINDTELLVQGDDLRLRQVLSNLLSNAVKYNKENGQVTLSSIIEKEGKLRIEVRDTGEGITSDQMALLFTPFERLNHTSGTISGIGIGLYMVKLLVEAMHGTVGVKSLPGTGSTFWLELPLADATNESTVTSEKNSLNID